jgi:hypothetical protein
VAYNTYNEGKVVLKSSMRMVSKGKRCQREREERGAVKVEQGLPTDERIGQREAAREVGAGSNAGSVWAGEGRNEGKLI